MAYKPVDRSYSKKYLEKQHEAIRWLAAQGMSYEGIREARWGLVDETEKTIKIPAKICNIRYDRKTELVFRKDYTKSVKIRLAGEKNEWYFLKSKLRCPWMFTRERPKTWRREGSKESLYSLSEIEKIIERDECSARLEGHSRRLDGSVLTKLLEFANIEISKLNITKLEPMDEIEEAEVVL